jgi:hypothetical protein
MLRELINIISSKLKGKSKSGVATYIEPVRPSLLDWKEKPEEYYLVEIIKDTGTRYMAAKITPVARGMIVIEDEDANTRITTQMKEDGIPVISLEEFRKQFLKSHEIIKSYRKS